MQSNYRVTFNNSLCEIRIIDLAQCCEYIGIASNDIDQHHAIFTSDHMVAMLQHLIEKKQYIIAAKDDQCLIINFRAELTFAEQIITDSIAVQCALRTHVQEHIAAQRICELEREVEDLRKSLAALIASDQSCKCLATTTALARDVAIRGLIADAEHRFGPIPEFQYEFAKKVFAAEFDGDPIVMPVIDLYYPHIMPWARSVVRVLHIGPMQHTWIISKLQCTRLIYDLSVNNYNCGGCDKKNMNLSPVQSGSRHGQSCYCKLYQLGNTDIWEIHPDIRELFIKCCVEISPIKCIWRREFYETWDRFIQFMNLLPLKPNIYVDRNIYHGYSDSPIITQAKIIDMPDYCVTTMPDLLRDKLELARQKTAGISVPEQPKTYHFIKMSIRNND